MIAVDTNILVLAHRESLAGHREIKKGLQDLGESPEPWGVPVFCVAEFIRVVTHPKVFDPPTPLDRALGFLDAMFEGPTVRLLTPGPRFLEVFSRCASG